MIDSIKINGLNGEYNITLPFKHGHCVVVGPNGVGKSTALQIIAQALGRQWGLLAKQRFTSIEIFSGSNSATLTRLACDSLSESRPGPSQYGRLIQRLIENEQLDEFITADLTRSEVQKIFHYVSASLPHLRSLQKYAMSTVRNKGATSEVAKFEKALHDFETPMTRYFPTSRRVEIELSKLTSKIPEYMRGEVTRVLSNHARTNYYEEIVRFGMEDVEEIIRSFEMYAQENSRNKFNVMMTQLLKEMANQEAISIKELRQYEVTEDKAERVLMRIEEGVLNEEERNGIIDIILGMSEPQKGGGHPPFHKRWLSHFFVKLLNVDTDLQKSEAPIVNLVGTLGKYLSPKTASYDIENYRFSIRSKDGEPVKLKELSSGEKQLVSMLTMLEFSEKPCNILIDEPELSLSVPWQITILDDLVASKKCNQLIAVTHSPFIFEKSLAGSVVDFMECVE